MSAFRTQDFSVKEKHLNAIQRTNPSLMPQTWLGTWGITSLPTKKVKGIPYTCSNYPRDPIFSPFHSAASYFPVKAILRQVHQMTPENDLKYSKRSKVLHIHATTTHESQISIRFVLKPAVFELQAIFRQVHPAYLNCYADTLAPMNCTFYIFQLTPTIMRLLYGYLKSFNIYLSARYCTFSILLVFSIPIVCQTTRQ